MSRRHQIGVTNKIAITAFEGVCNKKGHRANKCPKDKSSNRSGRGGGCSGRSGRGNGGRFQGKCHNCSKDGHREADCWAKEANANKRPNNYKPPGENENAAAAGTTKKRMAKGLIYVRQGA
jgi:hypothetical protein